MDVLRQVSDQGISVMVNLHSIELVKRYCTRVIGIQRGVVIFDGHPSDLTDDLLHQLYGDEFNQIH
jgi:phosphonate transport system ATP-binding protein